MPAASRARARDREALDYLESQHMLGNDALEAPRTLGEFELKRRIGGGGMGVVYLAEQPSLGRRVAVKLVRPELVLFPGSRARFQREVEATARLQHPGIVPVYAVGEQDGVPYFAMEYIEGASLSAVLSEVVGRQPETLTDADLREAFRRAAGRELEELSFAGPWWSVVSQIVLEVARAVEHAHHRGVLHRDIKPSNVMLSVAGRVQLVDFGLARSEGDAALTMSGTPIGSLAYMSPEQLEAGPEITETTDVYSLGITLYEVLSLRCPYLAETGSETRERILDGTPRPLRMDYRAVPRDLETVCLKAMTADPGHRYPSAAAFARDLGNAIAHKPISARRAGAWARMTRYARRHPARAALVVVLSLVIPTISILAGIQIANQDIVARGEAVREKEKIDALLQRGWLLRQVEPEGSRAVFDDVLASSPGHPLAVLGLLMLDIDTDGGKPALTLLDTHRELTERYPTFDLFRQRVSQGLTSGPETAKLPPLEETPPTAIDHFVAGQFRLTEGYNGEEVRFGEALILFERAIELSPEPQALFHLKKLESASMAQDSPRLLAVGRAIEVHWPRSAVALAYAGYYMTGAAPQRGIELLERSTTLDGEQALTWLYLATARRYTGQIDSCLEALERAVALDPEMTPAWSNLAEVCLVMSYRLPAETKPEMLNRALTSVQKALALDDADADVHGCHAEILNALGRTDDAAGAFDKLVELAPRQAWSYFKRGRFHSRTGNFAAALDDLRAAIERNDTVALMHHELAQAFRLAKKFTAAVRAAQRAVTLDAQNRDFQYGLALAQWSARDLVAARRTLEEMVRGTPGSELLHEEYLRLLEDIGDAPAAAAERKRWADRD